MNWEIVDAGTESYLKRTHAPVDKWEIFSTFEEAKVELLSIAEVRIEDYQNMQTYLNSTTEEDYG